MAIKLYNTLSRQKEAFVPRKPGEAAMYACGPTTYNYFHLGNGRMLVVFDMIRRYLGYRGFKVTYVQNFTDVDDKIIKRAAEEGKSPRELAEFYIREYFADAAALGILPADIHPKATEHIDDMIAMIRVLEEKGLAYAVEGDVYFAVTRFASYGRLSGRSLEDMRAGERVEVDARKGHPMDFALWKKAAPGEPFWESPWGRGRPGWHIECSAMSHKYLGPEFDIHGGGGDLVFPHHENEIAQSEGFMEGQRFARYWMHNAFVTVNKEKMAKSLGNFFLVREVLEKFAGEVIRFYLLSAHYRSPVDFDWEKLEMAAKGLERLRTSVRLADEYAARGSESGVRGSGERQEGKGQSHGEQTGKNHDPDPQAPNLESRISSQVRQDFEEVMDDDFNSAQGLAVLFDLARELNSVVSREGSLAEIIAMRDTLVELAGVLGFDVSAGNGAEDGADAKADGVVKLIMDLHKRAQEAQDPETTSLIESSCEAAGINLIKGLLPEGAGEPARGRRQLSTVMDIVLELRARARAAKDWAGADMIRDHCKESGIVIEDTKEGARFVIR
ncbi:MAG: cysteine--tRNA ligase [Peptococcaceae bacterium]|nr:cysteine--tRNA ligase [Peptococcaceae bacterium]